MNCRQCYANLEKISFCYLNYLKRYDIKFKNDFKYSSKINFCVSFSKVEIHSLVQPTIINFCCQVYSHNTFDSNFGLYHALCFAFYFRNRVLETRTFDPSRLSGVIEDGDCDL